jgi:hypothetical protein
MEKSNSSKTQEILLDFSVFVQLCCTLRIKGRFFNTHHTHHSSHSSLINIHVPTNDSEEKTKDKFYEQLELAYFVCPKNDVKLMMGVWNAKVEWETVH